MRGLRDDRLALRHRHRAGTGPIEDRTKNGVDLGEERDKASKDVGKTSVVATDFKTATWKGKPTVVRYLFIDAALPSKKLILMSYWASPEGHKAHDAEITGMIESLKLQE